MALKVDRTPVAATIAAALTSDRKQDMISSPFIKVLVSNGHCRFDNTGSGSPEMYGHDLGRCLVALGSTQNRKDQ
ncbi:hypothetical protein [Nocardia asiatica]|uniref:hypothetical protein n=1 Tax=Nocardia asiatica TaxID=209252 RepID=UPI003EE15D58